MQYREVVGDLERAAHGEITVSKDAQTSNHLILKTRGWMQFLADDLAQRFLQGLARHRLA